MEGVVAAVGTVVVDGCAGGAKEKEGVDEGTTLVLSWGTLGIAGVALGNTEKPDVVAVPGAEVVPSVLAAEGG